MDNLSSSTVSGVATVTTHYRNGICTCAMYCSRYESAYRNESTCMCWCHQAGDKATEAQP